MLTWYGKSLLCNEWRFANVGLVAQTNYLRQTRDRGHTVTWSPVIINYHLCCDLLKPGFIWCLISQKSLYQYISCTRYPLFRYFRIKRLSTTLTQTPFHKSYRIHILKPININMRSWVRCFNPMLSQVLTFGKVLVILIFEKCFSLSCPNTIYSKICILCGLFDSLLSTLVL